MRILILLDAYDEITTKATSDVHFLTRMVKRKEANITFLMSTRRHKTDEIMSGGHSASFWQIIRSYGVSNESVRQFFEQKMDPEKSSKMYEGQETNE